VVGIVDGAVLSVPDGAVLGVVLCGGASRRMGRPKPFVQVDGVAMARRVADALLAGGCSAVVAVGGDPEAIETIGLDTIPDGWPGEGPLGAVVTALETAGARGFVRLVVAPCDLPFVDPASVAGLLAVEGDVVVAEADRVQPLLSAWSPTLAARLGAEFAGGERRILSVLDRLPTPPVRVTVPAAVLVNVNGPGDLPQRGSAPQ